MTFEASALMSQAMFLAVSGDGVVALGFDRGFDPLQHIDPKRGGKVAFWRAIVIDLGQQCGKTHAAVAGNILQFAPESVFQGNTGTVTVQSG